MDEEAASEGNKTILIVDDEAQLAELFAAYLTPQYETRTAYSGQAALDSLDRDVDVIILDRRMIGMSGGEVLRTLRDRGFSQPAAMLTAVDPGDDLLELPVDEYLIKPITRDQFLGAVRALTERSRYDTLFREYFAAVSKKAVMETRMKSGEITASEAYSRLEHQIKTREHEVESALTETERNRVFPDFRDSRISTNQ